MTTHSPRLPLQICRTLSEIGEEENMASPAEFSAIFFSFCLCLPSFTGVVTVNGQPSMCAPSSCGHLRDIRYPFWLAGDPQAPPCGLPGYELVCEGNRTVLDLHSGKYYVRNILYESNRVRVVDVRLAGGGCSLPSRSPSPRSFDGDGRYNPAGSGWAAFVNCSRKIANAMYKPVPCMSGSRGGGTYVYLVHGELAYGLQYLQPSCHALSLTPLGYDANKALASGADVAEALQMGFEISWFGRSGRASKAQIIGVCLGYTFEIFLKDIRRGQSFGSPFSLEKNLYSCLHSNIYWWRISPRNGSKVDYGYIVVSTILLAVLHLIIVLALVGRFVVPPLTIFALLIRKFLAAHASIDTVEKFLQCQNMLMPARYTYPEIVRMTNHFEKKLGQGGFGSVFRGKLPGGHLVAVKMLSGSKGNGEEFTNEVSTLGRIHHANIMQLIGFSSEGEKRALIYEYMPNGSLDRFIFPSRGTSSSLISWERLDEIALGVARGIEYLHTGCDMCILHFDIKPQNILLDHNFLPKISDFGLAKLYPKDYSLVSVSAARGTIGYIAPELISRNFGTVSYKSDVYSFGMLLLEMAGARKKNMNAVVDQTSDVYFPTWIYDQLGEGRVVTRKDGVAEMGEIEKKLCIVGLWCIQMKPSARPSMSDVIEMLEGSTFALPMPPKPFFSSSLPRSVISSCVDTTTEDLSVISEV